MALTLLFEFRGRRLPNDGPHWSETPQKALKEPAMSALSVPHIHAPSHLGGGGDGGRLGHDGGGGGVGGKVVFLLSLM